MKNQYFGDVQDYRKYGLLRHLTGSGRMSLGVVWMLTPDDEGTDGAKIAYLNQSKPYRHLDPDLFDFLYKFVHEDKQRNVIQAGTIGFMPNAVFVSDVIPDDIESRRVIVSDALHAVSSVDLVFFDPDNGFEVDSCKKGKRNSSKYVYWDEIHRTYKNGHSVLIYQHFPRIARENYIQLRLQTLKSHSPGARVVAFCTSHVGFFLAMQNRHVEEIESRIPSLTGSWGNTFRCHYLAEIGML